MVERAMVLEERAQAGDKRAAWELAEMDRQLGIEPRDYSQPAKPRKKVPHMFAVDQLAENWNAGLIPGMGDAIREAVDSGILPAVPSPHDGTPCVLESDFEPWRIWFQQPIARHCPSCGFDLKGDPPNSA